MGRREAVLAVFAGEQEAMAAILASNLEAQGANTSALDADGRAAHRAMLSRSAAQLRQVQAMGLVVDSHEE